MNVHISFNCFNCVMLFLKSMHALHERHLYRSKIRDAFLSLISDNDEVNSLQKGEHKK